MHNGRSDNRSPLALVWLLVLSLLTPVAFAQPAATLDKAAKPAKAPVTQTVEQATWPPAIPNADANGVITLNDKAFLNVPDAVAKAAKELGYEFAVAKTSPVVDLVFHNDLPNPGVRPGNGTGWTSWGDICVASDGSVYMGIGDHGADGTRLKPDQKAEAYVYLYRWLPAEKKLVKVVSPNLVVQADGDDPNWSKVHAGIFEGKDNNIYFVPTFNDGQRAATMTWSDKIPTGQIFQYNPKTNTSKVVGLLPANSATATSEYDAKRNILYINLEGIHKNALFAFDLNTFKPVYQGPDGMIPQNRNMAMGNDGQLYYNGQDNHLFQYNPDTQKLADTGMLLPDQAALRASSGQSSDGWIYAASYGALAEGQKGKRGQFFRFNPETKKVESLGYDFLNIDKRGKSSLGNYTTVMVLSPDEKFVYYLPGAHGGAIHIGCPVIQYDIQNKTTKVIAFLRDVMETKAGYVPGGTYGMTISNDGGTLYVNFNGHAIEVTRRDKMQPNGFGLTGFAAVHVPESER